jgi:16S rRNA (uracil1498-N3)-methyltransferase
VSTPPLFFVDHLPRGERVQLTGEEARHAARVRRVAVGEAVLVADGLGAVADCDVLAIADSTVELAVRDWRTVPLPDPLLVVAQAPAKGDRAELAVELMTELGVDEVVPWTAERAVVKWRDGRDVRALERWRRSAREASKQSRRPRVPIVADPMTTGQLVERFATDRILVLHEQGDDRLAATPLPQHGALVLVVGPEGGVSDAELAQFTAGGAVAVRLGDQVLRTSTAGAAALAAVSLRLGRWG